MRGDGCREVGSRRATKSTASFVVMCSSTIFALEAFGSAARVPVDEHRLAVEDVDRRIGHFAMDQ